MIRRVSVASGICARCRMRRERLIRPTLPSPGGSDPTTPDHQWSSDPRIASFANRPDRAAQHFSGSRFGNCETNQTCAGRPKLPIWLSTSAIIAFSCKCATSRSSRLSLFRNDKRHRHLPFQRIFHPNHRHFGNARMTGDTLQSHAYPADVRQR